MVNLNIHKRRKELNRWGRVPQNLLLWSSPCTCQKCMCRVAWYAICTERNAQTMPQYVNKMPSHIEILLLKVIQPCKWVELALTPQCYQSGTQGQVCTVNECHHEHATTCTKLIELTFWNGVSVWQLHVITTDTHMSCTNPCTHHSTAWMLRYPLLCFNACIMC